MGSLATHWRSVAFAAAALAVLALGPASTGAAPTGLVGAFSFDAGSGSVSRRSFRQRKQRHHLGRHLDVRQDRRSAQLRRHERPRHRSELGIDRPAERHDPRGLGPTDGERFLADHRDQGGERQPSVRAVLRHGDRPPRGDPLDRLEVESGHRPLSERAVALDLDARRDDVRRVERPALRQRLAGRDHAAQRPVAAVGPTASESAATPSGPSGSGDSSTTSGSTTAR
jgi:hypothetical protein